MSLWSQFIDEFTTFAVEGQAADLAVGAVLGLGVTPVATSIVEDIVMPPFGMLLGSADLQNQFLVVSEGEDGGPYNTLKKAREDGAVTINYGKFINRTISLGVIILIAFGLVKLINKGKKAARLKKAERARQRAAQQAVINVEQASDSKVGVDPVTLVQKARAYDKVTAAVQNQGSLQGYHRR